jgi:cation:H+ antiporter
MIEIGLLILGLVMAVFGADRLVDGGSSFARRFNVSEVVIGAIIIGFGTSMPEFAVNVVASLRKDPALAVTNILGSNIFNILIILGISALITPLSIHKELRQKEIPYSIIAIVVMAVCGNEIFLDGFNFDSLIPSDGIVLLIFFGIFVYFTLASAKDNVLDEKAVVESSSGKAGGMVKFISHIVLGLIFLVGGGELIVLGASRFAENYGLSKHFVGLLIVGPGTSFPELIATVTAVKKKKHGMAVGNIIGSNIFNIFCILGLSSVICEIPLGESNLSILVCLAASLLLLLYAYSGNRMIGKLKGISFLIGYAVYIGYLIIKG